MIEIGQYNTLQIDRSTSVGLFLVHPSGQEVLLPNKYVPDSYEIGDPLDVFVYTDSEDRLIATSLTPYGIRDSFAGLTVKQTTSFGAFLDWGLEKDLLVPFNEQRRPMKEDHTYLVYLYLDNTTDRIVATSKYSKFLSQDPCDLEEGQQVQLWIGEKSDLGYEVVIEDKWPGLIYHSEIFSPISQCNETTGYIKHVREDGKIDVSLEASGYMRAVPFKVMDLEERLQEDGFLALTDKSSPEEIKKELGMSKKNFKKAVGALYKARKIELSENGIHWVK